VHAGVRGYLQECVRMCARIDVHAGVHAVSPTLLHTSRHKTYMESLNYSS
jgi:hypothetical protein